MKRIVWLGCLVVVCTSMMQASQRYPNIPGCVRAAHAGKLRRGDQVVLHGISHTIVGSRLLPTKETIESDKKTIEQAVVLKLGQDNGWFSKVDGTVKISRNQEFDLRDPQAKPTEYPFMERVYEPSCAKLAIAATAAVAGLLCLVLSTQAGSMPS